MGAAAPLAHALSEHGMKRDGSSTCAGPLLLGKEAGCARSNTFRKTQGQSDTSALQVLG